MSTRTPDHPIHPQFIARWSPRAFTGEAIPLQQLMSLLEAARWAPSGSNAQPWRFIYALAGTPAWAPMFDTLAGANQVWAQKASALVLVLSARQFVPPGKTDPQPMPSHAFDAGAAWACLALQASLDGWAAHGMGGFDKDRARAALGVPDDHDLHAVVAIGRPGPRDLLPEALQAREEPNGRHPLSTRVSEGRFIFSA